MVVVLKAMECAKSNQVKTSLSVSDPFMVQVFGDNLRKVIGDGVYLLFCNSGEVRSFAQIHSTEAAAEQVDEYAKTFVIALGAGGLLTYDGTALVQSLGVTANAVTPTTQVICMPEPFCMP
jgi:sugar/nucleoside kinase (ribokinase family)